MTTRTVTLRGDLVRIALLLTVFAVTLGGLHTILDGVAWWILSLVLCTIVFAAGLGVRMITEPTSARARILSPLVAGVAVAVTIIVRFASDVSILGFIPTGDTIDRVNALVRDAGYSITWQSVPAHADEAISFVLALGVAVLATLAEIFAFSVRRPALVGIPLAAIFLVPGLAPEGTTDGWFFAGSALAYLALLLAKRPKRYLTALGVGAFAIVGGLFLPSALPSTDISVTSSGLGPSVSTGVNPMLSLGDDLRENTKDRALTYSTVSNGPEYLRLVEVSDFHSKTWGPSPPNLDDDNRPSSFPRIPGLDVGVLTKKEVTYIHVANLVSPWLPLPYAASSVIGLSGSWQYLPDSFTVASGTSLARGEDYTVGSAKVLPTPQQLLDAGTRVPSGLARYLSLPENTPTSIGEAARKVTQGATSNYEKALAIQEYLRSAPFVYSETAPVAAGYDGTGVEYVAAFLEQHRGYCIHFASAMAVMARELGIPSRIIVGFQPGHQVSGDDRGRHLFEVTSADLHAWPELFFSGVGWIRFEPTPSRGTVPDYADQSVVGVPPVLAAGGGAGAPPTTDRGDAGLTIDDGPTVARWLTSGEVSSWFSIGGILAGAILLLLVPAMLRLGRRLRRIRALKSDSGAARAAWDEVLETAEDLEVVIGSTLTPRGVVARLARAQGMTGPRMEAMERIRALVERQGYGRPQRDAAPEVTLARDLAAVLAGLRASVDSGTRVRAVLLPPSLVRRVRSVVARIA